MRNWQRYTLTLTAGLCLCQLSYASGKDFRAESTTPTYATATVNTEVYDEAGWNSDLSVPTKDAVRDKIEALSIVSPLTTTSNVIFNTTKTDNFAVGTSDNLGKMVVSGDTDEIQLLVQAHTTQTNKIFVVQNQSGTDLFTISLDGTTIISGSGNQGTSITGIATFGAAVLPKVSALTDGATVALNLALGNVFTLSGGGNRTISAPTNGVGGQKFIIVHLASGGARTLSVDSVSARGFRFGTDLTGPLTATTSGKYDYIGCVINPTTLSADIVAVRKGY